jgi:hypothetical protein
MLPAQLLRTPPCFETGWLFYAIGTHSLIYYLGAATWSMMGWRRVLQVASTRCLLGRLHNFLASRVTFYDTLNDYKLSERMREALFEVLVEMGHFYMLAVLLSQR